MGELIEMGSHSFVPNPPQVEPDPQAENPEKEAEIVECANRMLGMAESRWDRGWSDLYQTEIVAEAKNRAIKKLQEVKEARAQAEEQLKQANTNITVVNRLEEE